MTFLEHGGIALVALERDHLKQAKGWRNDPHVRESFREFMPLNDDNQEEWFATLKGRKHIMFAIMIQGEGAAPQYAGVGGLTNIDWHNGCTEISWYVGIKKMQGYDKGIIKLLLKYGFEECRLHRIEAEVYDLAPDRAASLSGCGFEVEGVKYDAVYRHDKWHDSRRLYILEGMWRSQVDP